MKEVDQPRRNALSNRTKATFLAAMFIDSVLVSHFFYGAAAPQTNGKERPASVSPSPAACTGVEFIVPKQLPSPGDATGVALIEVVDVFNRPMLAKYWFGMVGQIVSGQDANTSLYEVDAGSPSNAQEGIGYFIYTWSPEDAKRLESTVRVQTYIDGHEFSCPPTKLTFDQETLTAEPGISKTSVPLIPTLSPTANILPAPITTYRLESANTVSTSVLD